MEALDPFARGATAKVRTERTGGIPHCHRALGQMRGAIRAIAGQQLRKLANVPADVKDPEQWSGFAKWAEQLSPMMSERKLRGRDDVIESTMRFAFQAEMAAQKDCGKLTLDDEALLLLARERMGASR